MGARSLNVAAMSHYLGRRRFLTNAVHGAGAVLSSTALSGLSGPSYAQSGGTDLSRAGSERVRGVSSPIVSAPLAKDLTLISGAGGNAVLLREGDANAMVDSGAPGASSELAALVSAELDGGPLDLLFNTHWHLDHTGGNEAVRHAASRIIAHENTKLWMGTEYYVDWEDHTYQPRAAVALPNETFYTSDPQPILVEVGGETIQYGHLGNAHTDGDVYVFFRERNVIVAGGVVSAGAYPVLDFATGGWIGGLMDATKSLLDLADANTLIVPDVGPAQKRAHLESQYEMVATVRGRIEDLMREGRSAEEMVAAEVTADFDAAWGENRERFVFNVYGGLWWQGRLQGSL
jgi:glyoxylase-like metal-dependent hydrolase (beta-lactamase superfamily II)